MASCLTYQRARTPPFPPLPPLGVEEGVVVPLSGVVDGVVMVPLSGVIDGVVVLLLGVVDGVVMVPGAPWMVLGVVVESVGLLPAGETDPPGAAVGAPMLPGIEESRDELGTITSFVDPLGAAEGLVGVPLGAALGEVVEPYEPP